MTNIAGHAGCAASKVANDQRHKEAPQTFSWPLLCGLMLVYKSVLEVCYVNVIIPRFGYYGFYFEPNLVLWWVTTALMILVAAMTPRDLSRASTYLLLILHSFVTVPMLSYTWLASKDWRYTALLVASVIVASWLLRIQPRALLWHSGLRTRDGSLQLVFFAYVVIAFVLLGIRGGIDERAFDLTAIYDLRSENQLSALSLYAVNWIAKALTPFFLALFLWKKRYGLAGLVAVVQLSLYLSFGNKAFLFSVPFLIVCFVLIKRNWFHHGFIVIMTVLVAMSSFVAHVGLSDMPMELSLFRTLFVPAQIQFQFYEFFQGREHLWFSETLIGRVQGIESPYAPSGITFYINWFYSDLDRVVNSNTGIFADSYANGGAIFVVLLGVILGLLLLVVDAATTNMPVYFAVSAFSFMAFVMNDASFTTMILTNGVWILVPLLVYLNSFSSADT